MKAANKYYEHLKRVADNVGCEEVWVSYQRHFNSLFVEFIFEDGARLRYCATDNAIETSVTDYIVEFAKKARQERKFSDEARQNNESGCKQGVGTKCETQKAQ